MKVSFYDSCNVSREAIVFMVLGQDRGATLQFKRVHFGVFSTFSFKTKQHNLIRCEVVTIEEVAIAPVSDGPGGEHHDECEHNCSLQLK